MRPGRSEEKRTEGQTAAPEEKKAGCPYKKKCGGCVYSGMEYPEQLKRKEQAVKKLLSGKGIVHPITGAEQPLYYRNKVTASFGFRNGKLIAGRIIHVIRDLCVSFKIKAFDEDSGFGLLRHVMVRTARKTGQVMVILVTASPMFPGSRNFVKALREKCPEITTVIQNINSLRTSMVLGNREKVLFGKGYIEDELCGLRFRISSGSFYQVNPEQTEKLYKKAIELAGLTGKELVLDAYCGVGTIGMIASRDAREVIGVELNADAVKDAEANAKTNGIGNIGFYANDAGAFLEDLSEEGVKPDVVLMDPPRTGSTPEFIKSVCGSKPKRVVYVSCNPETLARDVDVFRRYNYRMEEAWPFDNFPLTEHVETVALLKPVKG